MVAEVIHFYGFGWEELLDMEVPWFCAFHKRIPMIEARRLLPWMPVIAYPHLAEKADRDTQHRRLMEQAGYTPQAATRHRVERDDDPDHHAGDWSILRTFGQPGLAIRRNGEGMKHADD